MQTIARYCIAPLLALGVLALAVTGCGGSSKATGTHVSSASSGTRSTTRAPSGSFVARAEAVCRRVNTEIVALKAKSASAAEVKRIVPQTIAIEREGLARLEKLEPPASLAHDWQRMLGYRRMLARQLAQLLDIAQKNDGTSVKPLAAAKKRLHTSLSTVATSNGFTACAKIGAVG
jgi:hypothetical protein